MPEHDTSPQEEKTIETQKAGQVAPMQFCAPEGLASSRAALDMQPGRSLRMPAPVQAKMEDAFHADFSSVRFMESPAIGNAGAHAAAQGSTVGFAPGKFSPNTNAGQALIGHELSHVVSQAKGEVSAPQGKGLPFVADQGLEHRADVEGAKAARGESVSSSAGAPLRIASMSQSAPPVQGKLPWKKKKNEPKTNMQQSTGKPPVPEAPPSRDWEGQIQNKFSENNLEQQRLHHQLAGDNLEMLESDISPKVIQGMQQMQRNPEYHDAVLHNQSGTSMDQYVKTMNEEAADWIGNQLSPEELMMVLDYTDSSYTQYNAAKRGRMTDDLEKQKYLGQSDILDRALGKYSSKSDMIVYRGIDNFDALNFMIQDSGLRVSDANSRNSEDLIDIYNQTLPGALLREAGFMSTSVDRSNAESFAGGRGIVMQIHLPVGMRGAPIMNFSVYEHEREFLLGSGQLLEFKSAQSGPGSAPIQINLEGQPGLTEEGTKQPGVN